MDWQSEISLLWLPPGAGPYPADFATRAVPGTYDFYYLGLDAFAAIEDRWPQEHGKEPWAFILSEKRLLSPGEIKAMLPEWRQIMGHAATKAEANSNGRFQVEPSAS